MAPTAGLEFVLTAAAEIGGDTRMGKIMDTATMPAITWRPLVNEPLLCRICAINKGPKALAEPHAVSMSP